ncbi:MAG: nucleoside triphosphate pyrophosphatase [Bacteriovoracia bacterium]
MKLILASASPRRRELLKSTGASFEIRPAEIDESVKTNETPEAYVKRVCFEKALAVAKEQGLDFLKQKDWAILSADTTVVYKVGGKSKILGKPQDRIDAVRMLMQLSGKQHLVMTAFTWIGKSKKKKIKYTELVVTKVWFQKRPKSFWEWYASTGEPMDKAGAYGAQGVGMTFVSKVLGSYSNVIGLPLPNVCLSFERLFKESLFCL